MTDDAMTTHMFGETPRASQDTVDRQNLPAKALSIRQPWAWAIVHAGKDIENRSWQTAFRGEFCIHASAGMTNREWDDAADFMALIGVQPQRRSELQRGGIIGVAEITGCVRHHETDSLWFMGDFGFVLSNVRPVPFIKVKGALGFFDWRLNLALPPC